jgi:hypothetical protein
MIDDLIARFFTGMTSRNIAICGALAASIAWLFVVAWLMDRDAAARRQDRILSAPWMSTRRDGRPRW